MSTLDKIKNLSTLLIAKKAINNVGNGLLEETAIAGSGSKLPGGKMTREPLKGVSRSNAGALRREIDGSQSTSVEAIKGGSVPQGQLPLWLRKRSASVRHERSNVAKQNAAKSSKPLGLELDAQTKTILASLPKLDPSSESARRYLHIHANLLKLEHTPQDHANSKAHYDQLRTAWRFGEAQAIQDLRKASEKARREKNIELAQDLTKKAFERACALDWQCSTESWHAKSEAVRASGGKVVKKSKRYGIRAPTTTATAINFEQSSHQKRWRRHELRLLVVSAFGIRPAELKHKDGVRLKIIVKNGKTYIQAGVHGAKVDNQRGHEIRILMREITNDLDGVGLKQLASIIEASGGEVILCTTQADQLSCNRLLNSMQKGCSLYSYRHAVGSDLKTNIDAGTITATNAAEFMGHRSTASLCAYGYGKKGKAGKYKAKVDDMTKTVEKHSTFKPRETIHFPPRPPQTPHQQRSTSTPLATMKPKPSK